MARSMQIIAQSLKEKHPIQTVKRSFRSVFRAPTISSYTSQFDRLRSLPLPKDTHMIRFGTTIKLIHVLNRGLKKSISKADSDGQTDTSSWMEVGRKRIGRPFKSKGRKIDQQLFAYIARKRPLTKAMYSRLESLEAAGKIKISNLKSQGDIASTLVENQKEIQLSRFDTELIEKTLDSFKDRYSDLPPHKVKRIANLEQQGYLVRKEGVILPTDKYYRTKKQLIKMQKLDTRVQKSYRRPNTEVVTKDRNLIRRLNEDQVNLVKHLRSFSNMTEQQLYSLYLEKGTGDYFEKDLTELKRKRLLGYENRNYEDQPYKLFHLKPDGNKISEAFSDDISTYSRKSRKKDGEIIHDILQYEAYKELSDQIKAKGGHVTSVKTDQQVRAELLKKAAESVEGKYENFKSVKGLKYADYGDMEINYIDADGIEKRDIVEIDRGYDAEVIRKKSAAVPNMIWVTDSEKQANRISKHVVSAKKIMVLRD